MIIGKYLVLALVVAVIYVISPPGALGFFMGTVYTELYFLERRMEKMER